MARGNCHVLLLVALFVVLITLEATLVQANGNGNGNGDGGGNGSGKGKGDENGNGVGLDKEKKGKEGKDVSKGGDGNGKGGSGDEEDNGKGKGKGGKGDGDDKGKGKGSDEEDNGKEKGKGKMIRIRGKEREMRIREKGDEGKGEEGNGKGKGNEGKGDEGKGKGNGKGDQGKGEAATTHYKMVSPVEGTGQEQALCQSKGRCYNKKLTCPKECTVRKPKQSKKQKGCFIDCSKCETTCKYRRPNCEGYGSVCYDPRFVGGDGVMFYFHGAKGENFALVSDEHLQINAHFIGNRPQGRKRDFTWVQALAMMFDTHTLVIAARRVTKWDNNVDALIVRWDGDDVLVPTDGEAEWRVIGTGDSGGREVVVERTAETNSVRVTVEGLVEMDVKVTPIGGEENLVHHYELPADDAFAHLETQFRFKSFTDGVEGVLGKTYQPGYVSPVKVGVPMPLMGGEDRFRRPLIIDHVTDHEANTQPAAGIAQF
ncbi:hypothetical protein H6P81_011671 [Aristolochia fimbriata]|uniref:Uncharacterized protein n=1 Tax=Aristolochia fimbriata TaxID=158543 RepID=A0AAV7E9Z2_ARIFI|nr:hypothetical protein H6P81_011671 [Aristolochia fimbriata]